MLIKRIQLGMVHVSVAMTLVPINSTLNRVMIKEMAISATLVAILASLPYLLSPMQIAIGSFSDRHPLGGFRRTPYILLGLILCTVGLLLSPQAANLLESNFPVGILFCILAFGAWGMGFNFATVSYLSLATEISGENGRGRTVAIMWFMMIVSIILTAIGLSQMVDPYSPQALVKAFWIVGIVALFIGLLGLVKLERSRHELSASTEEYSWGMLTRFIWINHQAKIFFIYLTILVASLLGQDILLEPFGGEAFGMTVKQTTRITSIWGTSFLVALLSAGALEGRLSKRSTAKTGGWMAFAGFVLITLSGFFLNSDVFYGGVVLLGIGSGLATVSNLSLMLDMTTEEKVGLFIGAWGMSNAISRMLGAILSGVVRDLITRLTDNAVLGYVIVFGVLAAMILLSLLLLRSINVEAFRREANSAATYIEKAAIAGEFG